jgi:hypothetical protein
MSRWVSVVDESIRRALNGTGGFLTIGEIVTVTCLDHSTVRRRVRVLHQHGELGRLILDGTSDAVWWLLDPQIS